MQAFVVVAELLETKNLAGIVVEAECHPPLDCFQRFRPLMVRHHYLHFDWSKSEFVGHLPAHHLPFVEFVRCFGFGLVVEREFVAEAVPLIKL
jgi:hypothetical protein